MNNNLVYERTMMAGFPVKKCIWNFNFEFQKFIDKKVIDKLGTLRFEYNVKNLILLSPPGVVKTHLTIGLGLEEINARFAVYFINGATMIFRFTKAAHRDALERKLKILNKCKLTRKNYSLHEQWLKTLKTSVLKVEKRPLEEYEIYCGGASDE